MKINETLKAAMLLVIFLALYSGTATQTPAADGAARSGSLRQIIPDHYVYTTSTEGRLFNSGIVSTSDGVLVFDALDTTAIAPAERQFNGGSAVYADVFKIAHENYRARLIDQMQCTTRCRTGAPGTRRGIGQPGAAWTARIFEPEACESASARASGGL